MDFQKQKIVQRLNGVRFPSNQQSVIDINQISHHLLLLKEKIVESFLKNY